MANNELAIRFTEDKYATKNEVVNSLHIAAIDSFWNNILAYRSQFNRFSTLKTVDHDLIAVCCCSSINALINNAENKLLCLNREFLKIFSDSSKLNGVLRYSFDIIRKNQISDYYESTVRYAYQNFANVGSEDYLPEIFSKINNVSEITEYYRNDDSMSRENTALIDRVYKCAPKACIETMMNDLFAFSVNNTFSSIVKFALIYLYLIYTRPFENNYKEISMIYAKSVLAKDSLGELALIIPFEDILFNDSIMESYVALTQKTLDFTYYLRYFLEKVISCLDEYIHLLKNNNVDSLSNLEPIVSERKSTIVIDEKETAAVLNKYEIQLIQEDPRLKKKEAHFYSRHHEIGRKYSIAEYKRFSRCVYETARTSMDHLAELGYYKKIQIKNKFVYETIKR